MGILARGIKLPNLAPVQCPHDADARHHGWPVELDDQEQGFYRAVAECADRDTARQIRNAALTTEERFGIAAHYYWMARDRWVEKLRCPNCRKAGIARLSATDEFSWEIQMDGVPEGFKVVGSEFSSNFYCSSCDGPVEP